MADSKITDYSALSATPAKGDLLELVDISDTSLAATGTNKKIFPWRLGIPEPTATKTADYTAAAGEHVLCDANGASGSFTVTLPASPSAGDPVWVSLITDHTSRVVDIARNGSNINGKTTVTHLRLVIEGDTLQFLYVGGDCGWKLVDGIIPNRCMLRRDAALSTGNGAWTNITFDANVYDIGGIGSIVTNYRVTIRRAGVYRVLVRGGWANNFADGKNGWARITLNGTEWAVDPRISPFTNTYLVPQVSDDIVLAVGDYLEMDMFQDTGSSQNTGTGSGYKPRLIVQELRIGA